VNDATVNAEPPPPARLRAAWVAAADTLQRLGSTLEPLAVGLMDELVDVDLLRPDRPAGGDLPSPPVRVVPYRLSRWPGAEAGLAATLAEHLRGRKVQLLHALDAAAAPLTRRLARALAVPYLVTCHDQGDWKRIARGGAERAGVLAACEAVRAELAAHLGPQAGRVRLLRPGVHQVRHATCFRDPQRHVGLLAGAAGDDLPALQTALRSFAELHARKLPCVYFLLAGGRSERALRRQAGQLGLARELTFVAPQTAGRPADLFQAADLYVSPAPWPGLDVPALLAMARGVPVLAAAGGASDFLVNGQTALLFRRAEAAELTMKLTSLIDDRAAARALAENALEYLRRQHRPAEKVAALAAVYRQAVSAAQAAVGAAGK